MTVTVESEMKANFPDQDTFERFGGAVVLREACTKQLIAEGCSASDITFSAPWYEEAEEAWKIRGTGEKQEG